jgi:streptogramin lyase
MHRMRRLLVGVATLTWVPIAAAETLDRFYAGNAKYIDSVTRGPDGRVWFTFLHGIGAVEPDGRVTLHRLPGIDPASITAGPDGALWMTDSEKDLVVRRDMAGRLTTFRGLSSDASPGQITAGPDGNLWFIISP